MVHLDVPNGKNKLNTTLVRTVLVGWILLQTAALILICIEISRTI